MTTDLAGVSLVISSFRDDAAVLTVLRDLLRDGSHPFRTVLVVDSLGTGRVAECIESERWERVEYHNYDYNLGSAGNLAERLKLAARSGADFAYALNHDGQLSLHVVKRLLEVAKSDPRLGAVYPLLRHASRRGVYNVTGRVRVPLLALTTQHRPDEGSMRVWWGSSNGALYNLTPVRAGLLPWPIYGWDGRISATDGKWKDTVGGKW